MFLINVVNYTFGGLLTIGAGIKIIYQQCFKGATATSLTLEEGIEEIQGTAFRDFKVYGDLILPSTTKIVGQGAFQNATFNGWLDLSLLNQLETTGTNAFANNLFQGDLVIGPSFVSIKTSAFSGIPFNGVLDLSNASNLEEIATKAFFQSKFSTLIFPTNGKLNSIGDQTFHNSSITMNDFYLPNTLEKIGVSGFSGCKFNNIYIPLSVAEIGGSAFNESKTATFYYEGSSIPTGWSSNWNNHKRPVVFDAIF